MVKRIGKKAVENVTLSEGGNKVENFYVLYVLSSGLIDDLADLLLMLDESWDSLPVQVHIINLSGPNLNTEDLDTLKF